MKPLDFPLLADENIHPDVIRGLARQGKNVRSVIAEGLVGMADLEILHRAHAEGRVILTHDSDFGAIVYRSRQPFTGIIYLRPGHISATFVLETIAALEASTVEVRQGAQGAQNLRVLLPCVLAPLRDGKRTWVVRAAPHEYVFTEVR